MVGFAGDFIDDDLIWIPDWLWQYIFLIEDHGYFDFWGAHDVHFEFFDC